MLAPRLLRFAKQNGGVTRVQVSGIWKKVEKNHLRCITIYVLRFLSRAILPKPSSKRTEGVEVRNHRQAFRISGRARTSALGLRTARDISNYGWQFGSLSSAHLSHCRAKMLKSAQSTKQSLLKSAVSQSAHP